MSYDYLVPCRKNCRCDDCQFQALQSKVKALETKLNDAEQTLEFYANLKSYESQDNSRSTGDQVYDIILYDFSRNLSDRKDYAGKRARECLARIKGASDGK